MEASNDPSRPGVFKTTSWSIVRDAGQQASIALEQLCEVYWPPLYGFALRSGYDEHQAKDLTQGFFTHLLGNQTVSRADPAKGRFRSFLLTAFKRYMVSEWRRQQTHKRGGQVGFISWDEAIVEPVDDSCGDVSEKDYDQQWAVRLLDRTMQAVRQEYAFSNRVHIFDALQWSLSTCDSNRPYASIARELKMSESGVKMNVKRMRTRYGELLRQQVAQTVSDPGDVDDELRYLMSVLQDYVT